MSDKALVQKMFIKPGYRVILANTPVGYDNVLEPLPDDVELVAPGDEKVDVAVVFAVDRVELETVVAPLLPELKDGGVIWIAFPKGTGAIKSDINRDKIWPYMTTLGMTPNLNVAIDETWSALRFRRV